MEMFDRPRPYEHVETEVIENAFNELLNTEDDSDIIPKFDALFSLMKNGCTSEQVRKAMKFVGSDRVMKMNDSDKYLIYESFCSLLKTVKPHVEIAACAIELEYRVIMAGGSADDEYYKKFDDLRTKVRSLYLIGGIK